MDELDFAKIGLKMKELRTELGYTQEDVARDLGCTVSFISNVENNRTKLNLRLLTYYAALCKVPVDSFLEAGHPGKPQEEHDRLMEDELLQLFRTFSCEEKKKIIRTLKLWCKNF